ncbi:MAG: phosphatase PAP2 family protein [Bacteriovoracaceae bacterium]|nr:phosphatase PAP2 family protein [Bacteriovoracaceae bacterium]
MEILKIILILYSVLVTSNVVRAESTKTDLILSDLKSPITTPAVWILGAGSITTAMMYITKKNIAYRQRVSFQDAKPLGNLGFIGDYVGYGLLNLTYFSYHYYQYQQHQNPESLKRAEHMMRATLYTFGTTSALKYAIKEKRPGYPDDKHSFPSGHASASFAFASVVAAQHGWVWGGAAHALASFIATSRINDDFHYLHDITAGITIGASYAWGVYYNLEKGSDYWLTLVPAPKRGVGLAFGFDY